jgi:hypothetical protein
VKQHFEKSLDDQFAMERARQDAGSRLNRRLNWVMLPLGIALAVVAYYMDISARIAIPAIAKLQAAGADSFSRSDYEVFRLDTWAFIRLVPAAVIAGAVSAWFSVFVGTMYGRNVIIVMYGLIGLIYAASLTALLGILIPLNVTILDKLGLAVTDAEIPYSDEITSFGDVSAVFPLSYLTTGMERGLWAGIAVIVLLVIVQRLSGGLATLGGHFRSMLLSTANGVIVTGTLLIGPIGFQQYLFDRFVQIPSNSSIGYSPAIDK